MLTTLYKTLRMDARLNAHSYISTMKFNKSCISQQTLPSLNKDQEFKIVETVNKSTIKELEEYNLKPIEIKKIIAFKEKKGNFNTFNDILISQDLPMIIKLCKSILIDEKKIYKLKSTGKPKSIVTPTLDVAAKQNIKKILGIRVWGNRISWAMIDQNMNICLWDSKILDSGLKTSLTTLVNVVIDIISNLPEVDAYIMEADSYTSLNKLNVASYGFHLQRQQIIAIIITFLKMKQRTINEKNVERNNFYTLQPHAAAKRFNLRVGSETVSSISLVENILVGRLNSDNELTISIEPKNRMQYLSEEPEIREQLNAVLLIAITFSELVNDTKLVKV